MNANSNTTPSAAEILELARSGDPIAGRAVSLWTARLTRQHAERLEETCTTLPVQAWPAIDVGEFEGLTETYAEILERTLSGERILNDLRGAKLIGADFGGADLAGAMFSGANLEGANFRGANLDSAYFESANLENAIFDKATLKNTKLDGAILTNASLEGATIMGVDLGLLRTARGESGIMLTPEDRVPLVNLIQLYDAINGDGESNQEGVEQ